VHVYSAVDNILSSVSSYTVCSIMCRSYLVVCSEFRTKSFATVQSVFALMLMLVTVYYCVLYLMCCVYTRCVTKEAVVPVDAFGLYCSTMLSSARERPVRYVLANV
jgi:hypothetical protein